MESASSVAGEELLPSSADTRMIETNGQTLHTVIAGPEDGPPVVLLHGFPEFWYGWRYQIPALVDAGYRVIVPDQRGYNKSSKPRGLGAYTIDSMVADTEGLIDALGYDRVSLVGHDWGAGVTWHTLLRAPERVDRAGILNVPHPEVFEEYLFSKPSQLLKSWYMFTFQLPRIAEWAYSAGDWYGVRRVFLLTANQADVFTDAEMDVSASVGTTRSVHRDAQLVPCDLPEGRTGSTHNDRRCPDDHHLGDTGSVPPSRDGA
jgi:pimeloyl-ACP methyl ester carboxylesterase